MSTTFRQRTASALIAAAAMGLALGLVLINPDGTSAAPVPPGGDSHQIGCKSLQDQAQDLVDEYGDDDTTDARREQILSELRNIGSDWIAIKCKARYGNILMEVPGTTTGKFSNQVNLETAGVYQEPTTSTSPKTQIIKTTTFYAAR